MKIISVYGNPDRCEAIVDDRIILTSYNKKSILTGIVESAALNGLLISYIDMGRCMQQL